MRSSILSKAVLAAALFPMMAASVARAGTAASGTLYFTTYSGTPNIHTVDYTYDGATSFSLSKVTDIASTVGADGIVFNPNNGNLLIGGQNNNVVHEITTGGVSVANSSTPSDSFHLSVDPSGTRVWVGGIPGGLVEVPLTPTVGASIAYTVSGSTTDLDTLAWHGSTILYTDSGGGGNGTYGSITIDTVNHTAVTTQLGSMPATHGMTYDPFSNTFILIGDHHITQVDANNPATVVSDRTVSSQITFDQGAVDGLGHGFFADNNGTLYFLDYSQSGLVNGAGTFSADPFLADTLDDVAPIIGPGGSNGAPEASTWASGIALAGIAGFVAVRRTRRNAR